MEKIERWIEIRPPQKALETELLVTAKWLALAMGALFFGEVLLAGLKALF